MLIHICISTVNVLLVTHFCFTSVKKSKNIIRAQILTYLNMVVYKLSFIFAYGNA